MTMLKKHNGNNNKYITTLTTNKNPYNFVNEAIK